MRGGRSLGGEVEIGVASGADCVLECAARVGVNEGADCAMECAAEIVADDDVDDVGCVLECAVMGIL